MTTNHDWVTRYLDFEADRVIVDDMLYEVEHGIKPVFVATPHDVRPRPSSIVMAMVAAVVVFAVGAGLLADRWTPSPANLAADTGDTGDPVAVEPATDPTTEPSVAEQIAAPTTVPAPTTTSPMSDELPEGGIWLQGQIPSCSMINADVYECTLNAPFDPYFPPGPHEIGMTEIYVNSSSLVAGGCRSTSTDAQDWLCYVGGRAVAEGIVSADYLGRFEPAEFAAG